MPDVLPGLDGIADCDVSRETLDRLHGLQLLLEKWNPAINLVSARSLQQGWTRHIRDSAQVFFAVSNPRGHWLDIGSGGGFPGLVCAILAKELAPDLRFSLVESDQRKCAFLRMAATELNLNPEILPTRIESLTPQAADVVSARAVAALPELLDYAVPHLAATGRCVFPKGARYAQEIHSAKARWRFKLDLKPSITDPESAILVLGDITRV